MKLSWVVALALTAADSQNSEKSRWYKRYISADMGNKLTKFLGERRNTLQEGEFKLEVDSCLSGHHVKKGTIQLS